MTVPSSDIGPWEYTGNASTTTFAYLNKIFADSDIQVYEDGVQVTTGFTVTGAGDPDGGNVVYAVAPASGVTVTLVRDVEDKQELDLVENAGLPSEDLERALDRRTIVSQQQDEALGRSLHYPFGEPGAPSATLPAKATRAQKMLGFDPAGALALFSELDKSADTVTPSGGTTAQTLANLFADLRITPEDFGAVGDGATLDQAAVEAALTRHAVSGAPIYLQRTYLTNANLAGLHTALFFGPGAIKRGTALFKPEPGDGDTNTLYIATTGNDSNDGLGTSQPFATLQAALDALVNYGPVMPGTWKIVGAAGTYTASGTAVPADLHFANRLVIEGPDVNGHPNVPTFILDGSTGSSGQHALTLGARGFAEFKDIKAINYSHADTSTGGFTAQNGADLLLTNCHCTGSSWFGCTGTAKASKLLVDGGIWDGSRINIRMNYCQFTIGHNASQLSEGPIVKNATESGVLGSRLSQGHCDYANFDGNVYHIAADRLGRVADVACDFKNASGAVFKLRTGGVVAGDKDNDYHLTDGDANAKIFDIGAFSGPQEEILDRTDTDVAQDARSEVLIARDLGSASHTGDAIRTIVATPYTIPAGYFMDGGGNIDLRGARLRFKITGSKTNGGTPGIGQIGLQFGGNNINQWSLRDTNADDWVLEAEIWARGTAAQTLEGTLYHENAGTVVMDREGRVGRSIDMTVDRDVQIDVQLADAGDTVTVETVEIWRTG